ncbi:MAG: lytic murein transglycosylase [Rhodospirillales bacterium]|nr:lytic murein transglycosylase [Rhodospirillales bacterium]
MVFVWLLALAPTPTNAADESFDEWRMNFRAAALASGIRAGTFDTAFAGVSPIPRIIELDRRQPEFTQTFWNYLDKRVTNERVNRGQELLHRHRDVLAAVQRQYGVQPRFLVAFWGLETNYGGNTGGYSLIGALATLAHDARRSDFFRQQLMAALELMDSGDIPTNAKSSWAGAVGNPQFMPTSYKAFAVDFDGDGKRDLWNSLPDVFASAANYLAASGWQGDRTWGREVRLPGDFDYLQSGLDTKMRLADWQRLGVRRSDGRDLPFVDIDASLILPGGAQGGPPLIVYDNFHAIMAWNRSILYAVSVGHLSDRLDGRPPFQSRRPAHEVPLSRGEVMEMQNLLTQVGMDTGGIDGIVGTGTRRAIRRYQSHASLPADGYPTPGLLQHLRQGAPR